MKESVRLEKRLRTVKVIEGILFIVGFLLEIPCVVACGVDFFVDVPFDILSPLAYVAAIGFMLIMASFLLYGVQSDLETKLYNALRVQNSEL